jgi:hypothetical protein
MIRPACCVSGTTTRVTLTFKARAETFLHTMFLSTIPISTRGVLKGQY